MSNLALTLSSTWTAVNNNPASPLQILKPDLRRITFVEMAQQADVPSADTVGLDLPPGAVVTLSMPGFLWLRVADGLGSCQVQTNNQQAPH